jgi:DNA polymerase-3 subunit delta'
LRFGPLDNADVAAILRAHVPDAEPAEIDALVEVGKGSPGRALRFAGLDIAGLDAALSALARDGDTQNARRLALAQQLSGKGAQARYEAFLQRVPAFLAAQAQQRQGDALGLALSHWEQARQLAAQAVSTSLDPQNVVFTLAGHVAALAPGGASAKA